MAGDLPTDPTANAAGDAATEAGEPSEGGGAATAFRGYQVLSRIGLGGMGEVMLGHHHEIGREVAIKRMRADAPSPDAVQRFLREAKIQARLEHPAIVPVHELGYDARGLPYFTMKRLAGTTLAHVLSKPPPRERLLRNFVEVVRAVDFAHTRGVVHRDLKPSNIMLGDFGEVYVLDWGVARVLGEKDGDSLGGAPVVADEGMTADGAMLGTLGYMAPEQIEHANEVQPAADVYSLGVILFEILAGSPLHPAGRDALLATLKGDLAAPSARAPDRAVPPELDALCLAALARLPSARPTTRALADAIERYLDGDRDMAQRRALSGVELAAARAAFAVPARRSEALRFAGRALALDPDSREAADLFGTMVLSPPDDPPADLRADLDKSLDDVQRKQARAAMLSFAAIGALLVAAAWRGLDHWALFVATATYTGMLAMVALRVSRGGVGARGMMLVALGNAGLAALLSRMFGSLIVAPGVTCVMAVSLTSYPQLIDRVRFVIPLLVASWLVPVVLEAAGVLESSWHIDHGAVISTSQVIDLEAAPTRFLLIVANVTEIIVIGLFASSLAARRRDAVRRLEIQAWHLRQLLPDETIRLSPGYPSRTP